MIKVSFILPCYNTGNYLFQCVDSLTKQGFKEDEYEIICVNNASTDNTAELLKELVLKHPVVKIVTLVINQCAGGAYNAGLDIAQGKYIQFVDSDDFLKKESVIGVYHLMERDSLELLYFNIESFKGENELTYLDDFRFNGNFLNVINKTTGEGFLTAFLHTHRIENIPVPAYRKMILRSKLVESGIRFSPTTIGTDFVHNLELLSKFNKIAAICDKIYMFRFNPNGVTKSKMTSSKIVYALNNYSKAFELVVDSDWSESNKIKLTRELSTTINRYLRYLKDVKSNDAIWIYQQLCYIHTLKSVAKGKLSILYLSHPKMYGWLLRIMPYLFIRVTYKLFN